MFSIKKQLNVFLFLIPASLALLLGGCLSAVNLPQWHQHDLATLSPIVIPASKHAPLTLLLSTAKATPGYNSAKMAYRLGIDDLQYFSTHRWQAPPARLLQQQIAQALQKRRSYRAIVTAPFSGHIDRRLDIELIYLRQTYHPKNRQAVWVDLKVQLTLLDAQKQRVIQQKIVTLRNRCEKAGPDAFAKTAENLLQTRLIAEVTQMTENDVN